MLTEISSYFMEKMKKEWQFTNLADKVHFDNNLSNVVVYA